VERYFDLGSPQDLSALPLDPVALADALEAEGTAPGDGDPWVATNMVATLDGAATLEGRSGQIGGAGDRVLFAAIRALADVIVAGAARRGGSAPFAPWPPPEVQDWRVTTATVGTGARPFATRQSWTSGGGTAGR
jgi:hypothetical protein